MILDYVEDKDEIEYDKLRARNGNSVSKQRRSEATVQSRRAFSNHVFRLRVLNISATSQKELKLRNNS